MSLADLAGDEPSLRDSPLESDRFGLGLARLVVPDGWDGPDDEVARLVAGSDADVIVARWPASRVRLAAALAGTNRQVLPAETLVYWAQPVPAQPPTAAEDVLAGLDRALAAEVEEAVRASFAGYLNHYAANPLLGSVTVADAYADWAGRAVRERPEHQVALTSEGRVVGIATCLVAGDDLEIELAGMVPEAQGRGLYRHLLAGALAVAARASCSRLVISTQAHNVGVQRVWARAGLEPIAAYSTVHAVASDAWSRAGVAGDLA